MNATDAYEMARRHGWLERIRSEVITDAPPPPDEGIEAMRFYRHPHTRRSEMSEAS